jgi:FMN-dependent NADH-azoreductase
MSAYDHQETYLRQVLGFIGITDIEFVRAEGVAMGDDARNQAIQHGLAHADVLARRDEPVAA